MTDPEVTPLLNETTETAQSPSLQEPLVSNLRCEINASERRCDLIVQVFISLLVLQSVWFAMTQQLLAATIP